MLDNCFIIKIYEVDYESIDILSFSLSIEYNFLKAERTSAAVCVDGDRISAICINWAVFQILKDWTMDLLCKLKYLSTIRISNYLTNFRSFPLLDAEFLTGIEIEIEFYHYNLVFSLSS